MTKRRYRFVRAESFHIGNVVYSMGVEWLVRDVIRREAGYVNIKMVDDNGNQIQISWPNGDRRWQRITL